MKQIVAASRSECRRWLAISAKSQMDVRLAKDLVIRGVESFVAVIYRRQKIASHAWPVPEKWLSPYVFVQIEDDDQIGTVRNSLGFDEFLILEPPKLKVIPDNVVQHLKMHALDSLAEAESRSRPAESIYHVGQFVTVVEGPFAGKAGKIDKILGKRFRIDAGGAFPVIAKEREVMES